MKPTVKCRKGEKNVVDKLGAEDAVKLDKLEQIIKERRLKGGKKSGADRPEN